MTWRERLSDPWNVRGMAEVSQALREYDTPSVADEQLADGRLLEAWRLRLRTIVTQTRTDRGGQLDQLLGGGADAGGSPVTPGAVDPRPRLRIDGEVLAWDALAGAWDGCDGQLVVLAGAGHGKTVAALTLVAHINARDEPGARVAELFSVADWYRWHSRTPRVLLEDWLADQLTLSHPSELPQGVSRQLVAAGLVLPVLDGMQEISADYERRRFVEVVDAYMRRTGARAPFVLTSGADEFSRVRQDCFGAVAQVEIAGLEPDQVHAILPFEDSGWSAIRARYDGGDPALRELLASPLHLSLAREAYRDRDPGELLDLSVQQARERLWDRLVGDSAAPAFESAAPAQIGAWLAFLAAGIKRGGRQRFALHELYLLDSDPVATLRPLLRTFGAICALVSGLAFGLLFGAMKGVVAAFMIGVLGAGRRGLLGVAPTIRARVGWRARTSYALGGEKLVRCAASALAGAMIGSLGGALTDAVVRSRQHLPLADIVFSPAKAAVGALAGALLFAAIMMVDAGSKVVAAGEPWPFAHARPDAELVLIARNGLALGLAGGLLGGLVGGLGGLYLAGAFGLMFGLLYGRMSGLDSWLHHRVLRRRLAEQGLLPADLPAFLHWCAAPERRWLLITGAYEFRNRELLDQLARSPMRAGQAGGRSSGSGIS